MHSVAVVADGLGLRIMEETAVACGGVELVHVCAAGLRVWLSVRATRRSGENTRFEAVTIIILIILERIPIHSEHIGRLHQSP